MDTAQLIFAASRRVRSDIRDMGTPAPTKSHSSNGRHSHGESRNKKGHDIGMRLKGSSRKCSGDLGECWMEKVD